MKPVHAAILAKYSGIRPDKSIVYPAKKEVVCR